MTRKIGFQHRDVERQSKLEGRVGVGEWRLDNHVDHVEQVEGKRVRGCGGGGIRIRRHRRGNWRGGERRRRD